MAARILRFSDKDHADTVARLYFGQLLANGTTTVVTFAADIHTRTHEERHEWRTG
jgi:cytosine/adenosine deaminase-related metal-dependent hydrolase